MAEDSAVPFVKLVQSKSGKMIKDTGQAQELTTFLHARAGLAFHYQLFCASSDIFPYTLLKFLEKIFHTCLLDHFQFIFLSNNHFDFD